MLRLEHVLLASAAMLLAAADPPTGDGQLADETPFERTYTIRGNSLTIHPSEEVSYLKFAGGVTVDGDSFALSADVVELDVLSGSVTGGQSLKLPKAPLTVERAVSDPGQTAAAMARELKLPKAQALFTTSAVLRVGAAGSVVIRTPQVNVTAGELVSMDGGRSWATNGRSVAEYDNQAAGEYYRLAADYLIYDRESERGVARGAIFARMAFGDDPPIEVEAERCEFDIGTSQFSVSEGLVARQGTLSLRCGAMTAHLDQRTLLAEDTPQLTYAGDGWDVVLEAVSINVDLNAQLASAEGPTQLTELHHGMTLTAESMTVELTDRSLTASGNPVARYRDSIYRGERIIARQDGERIVIEVEGPQSAHFNLDDLPEIHDDESSAHLDHQGG